MNDELTRRQFLRTTSVAGAAAFLPTTLLMNPQKPALKIACQHYTWFTYFRREGKEWEKDLEASFSALQAAGLEGYEPSYRDPAHVGNLDSVMTKKNIWTSSTYVNSVLHEADKVEQSISDVLAIAKAAKQVGINIIVTNPSPIQWGEPIDKTDEQILLQAKALNNLGAKLRNMGIQLAYHTHDMEMRQSAREFHHMLLHTDPANVKLCLDAHWVYRGSGDSSVALFDIVKLYGDRVVELHLRQSKDGIWSEVFGEGDIDYDRLAGEMLDRKLRPHLVLEQAVEKGTPNTMDAVSAIGQSLVKVQEIFQSFAR